MRRPLALLVAFVAVAGFAALAALAPGALAVVGLAAPPIVALVAALGLARVASRPKRRRLPRKSFARGAAEAIAARPLSVDEAVAWLQAGGAGTLVDAREVAPEAVEVRLRTARRQGCERAQGALTGLFESVWAGDVVVVHESCGRGRTPCAFRVARASVSGAGRRAAAASTRGS